MPTAQVGPENPLPPLFSAADIVSIDTAAADAEMRRNIGYGRVRTVLPYLLQDGYGRDRHPAEHKVAVLENDVLRATFLLDRGGRLWSLVHKPTGRELLHRNPVFQPANLALRNAWFAGGVGVEHRDHRALAHHLRAAARCLRPPTGRHADLADVRVRAVARSRLPGRRLAALRTPGAAGPRPDPESQRHRGTPLLVVQRRRAPVGRRSRPRTADAAWQFSSDRRLRRVPIPGFEGRDRTTRRARRRPPTTSSRSTTTSVAGSLRWTAGGTGLVQTSTDLLRGRKLFLWGKERRRGPLAGVALRAGRGVPSRYRRTRPDPARAPADAGTRLSGPGSRRTDCSKATRTLSTRADWSRARRAVARDLEALVPRAALDRVLADTLSWADTEPDEVLNTGSGWGALERIVREGDGDRSLNLTGTPFADESLGPQQATWLQLLQTGRLPSPPVEQAPSSYQVSSRWVPLLEAADGWLAMPHLGVIRAVAGDIEGGDRRLDPVDRHRAHRVGLAQPGCPGAGRRRPTVGRPPVPPGTRPATRPRTAGR